MSIVCDETELQDKKSEEERILLLLIKWKKQFVDLVSESKIRLVLMKILKLECGELFSEMN